MSPPTREIFIGNAVKFIFSIFDFPSIKINLQARAIHTVQNYESGFSVHSNNGLPTEIRQQTETLNSEHCELLNWAKDC